ncbi:MAG TPA: hypothetical protein V6D26_11465 [Stenomitos sp.]
MSDHADYRRCRDADTSEQWQAFLDTLGDRYWDKNQNPAYQLFLG